MDKIIYRELSYQIVGVMYDVYNTLGYGYQEKYYERAVEKLFILKNISYKKQVPYKIAFRGEIIGRYFLDFLVDDKIIIELKRGNYFAKRNIEQVKAYLKITNLKLAILANFTPSGVRLYRVLNPQNQFE